MSLTSSGKTIYWKKGETLEIEIPEIYHVEEYRGVSYPVVGKLQFKHFTPGKPSDYCPGRELCQACQSGNKPSPRYIITAMFDGQMRYCELNSQVSKEIGKIQKNEIEDNGTTPETVTKMLWKITKLPAHPWWSVSGIRPKAKVIKLEEVLEEEDVEEVIEMVAEEIAIFPLTDKEVAFLEKLSKAILTAKETNPNISVPDTVEGNLKKAKWTVERRELAKSMFDEDGNFVEVI